MPKADENTLALEALSRAMADPAPKPLLGTKAKPGMFIGSTAAVKSTAQRCLDRGWFEATAGFEGQGRTKKALYRITPAGIAHALEHGQAAELLRDMLIALDAQAKRLERMQADVVNAGELTKAQTRAAKELLARVVPPDISSQPVASANSDWLAKAVQYLAEYRRKNPYGRCPLPELFQQAASGLSIGQFHDGVRQLAAQGRITLHPFTGAAYQLRDEQYAIVAGQEIKYYVELVEG